MRARCCVFANATRRMKAVLAARRDQRRREGGRRAMIAPWIVALNGPLREALTRQAATGKTTTYRELADRLGLRPPHTIHRLALALEILMEEDVAAGRPILAA